MSEQREKREGGEKRDGRRDRGSEVPMRAEGEIVPPTELDIDEGNERIDATPAARVEERGEGPANREG